MRMGMGLHDWLRAKGSTLPQNLVSYWTLNEAGDTRYDSVGSNDLTPSASVPDVVTGISGNAVEFSAAAQNYLEAAFDASLDIGVASAGASWSTWIKRTDQTSTLYAIYGTSAASNPAFELRTGNTGKVSFYFRDPSNNIKLMNTNPVIWNGDWHHVAITYDVASGLLNAYVDNAAATPVACGAGTTIKSNTGATFRIGKALTYNSAHTVDEFAIWNVALTATQVSELYNAGAGKFYPFV
jgi:hypothetical protein